MPRHKRELDRLSDIEDYTPGSDTNAKEIKRRRLLPSPSTSCSAEREV